MSNGNNGDDPKDERSVERKQPSSTEFSSHPPASAPPSGMPPALAQLLMRQEVTAGPLPPPAVLKEYEVVIPGFSEKLLTAFLAEGEHRREADREQWKTRTRGMWFAFWVVVIFAAVATYTIHLGNPWAGVALLGADLAGLVTVFIYSAKGAARRTAAQLRRKDEREPDEPRSEER